MKKFIVILSTLITLPAFADSVKTAIPSFSGKLSVDQSIDLKKIEVEVINQFCTFSGSSCAGGPQVRNLLPIIESSSNGGKLISVTNETDSDLSSSKFGNRFSSCKINLNVEGIDKRGETINGSYSLVYTNDKAVCSSREALRKLINGRLTSTLNVKDGNSYISIK